MRQQRRRFQHETELGRRQAARAAEEAARAAAATTIQAAVRRRLAQKKVGAGMAGGACVEGASEACCHTWLAGCLLLPSLLR
jgi:hypothetical protein